MKSLSAICRGSGIPFSAQSDPLISDITNDSRKAGQAILFIAASGYHPDVHSFIPAAYAKGCRAFVIDSQHPELLQQYPDAWFATVDDIGMALARICRVFFDDPAASLRLIGITGTNGKTTTSTVIFRTLRLMGYHCGLIGTIEYRIDDLVEPASNTTPDILDLYRLLSRMRNSDTQFVIMEVSSHALALGRVEGLPFEITCFTNLTQDHLDFHRDMEDYLSAKLHLFDIQATAALPRKTAIVNCDIPPFAKIREHLRLLPSIRTLSFSLNNDEADYYAVIDLLAPDQALFRVQGSSVRISMTGRPNIYNFTLAYAVLHELGMDPGGFVPFFQNITVRGRMEALHTPAGYSIIIDYAHSPDALENLLRTCRAVLQEPGRLLCVFGAGGDRDKTKRPLMGRAACELSDIVVLTSDNPRTEDPAAILDDIEAGMQACQGKFYREIDRKEAIIKALNMAENQDIVVIAGKGHEDYQIIGKTKHHFSDREIVEKIIGL